MRFSVVIPVYNGERFLREAIDSVLAQTRAVDDLVVYDDGSADTSREICAMYGSAVRLIKGVNGPSGFVNGWNKALTYAAGDYIAILHQDDFIYPGFFSQIESTLLRHRDVRHLFAVCDYVDERSATVAAFPVMGAHEVRYSGSAYVKAYQQSYGQFPHIHRCPGVVTHRSIFEKDGCMYRAEAGHIADDDFFYRVGQHTDVVGLLTPQAAYRLHDESATGVLDNQQITFQLAKDYLYQVKQWKNSSFLDDNQKYYYEYWALKYALRSLIGALKNNDKNRFIGSSQIFASLLSVGLINNHGWLLRKIQYLIALEKVTGFSLLGLLIRKYA